MISNPYYKTIGYAYADLSGSGFSLRIGNKSYRVNKPLFPDPNDPDKLIVGEFVIPLSAKIKYYQDPSNRSWLMFKIKRKAKNKLKQILRFILRIKAI